MSGSAPHRDCEAIGASTETLLGELARKYRERGQDEAWTEEAADWGEILEQLKQVEGVGFNYVLDKVLGVGGAGAVFRVVDCNLFADIGGGASRGPETRRRDAYRALKVPRPHYDLGERLAESLRDEIARLTSLTHPYVIGLVAKGQVDVVRRAKPLAWPWYIMGYLHEPRDLEEVCRTATPELPVLIRYLYEIAQALAFIHEQGVVHCDVKPRNIFVPQAAKGSAAAHAVLADFGYAKRLLAQGPDTTVGFTSQYAHPELQRGAQVSSQQSRSHTRLQRSILKPAFDLYALGISIVELLTYYKAFRTYAEYHYELKYVRLCAARLLDGHNATVGVTFGGLPYTAFQDRGERRGLRYRAASELVIDLAKLLGEYHPSTRIPELVETHRRNVQVSDTAPAIYTERLRLLVDHPLLRRLAGVSQLGLVSLVYPGAVHSRLEHALGTFGVAAQYIRSLYADELDPLFRQLATEPMLEATLLAALLHDAGQYPLAHDLEDVSVTFFGHEQFGLELLREPVQTDLVSGPLRSELAAGFRQLVHDSWAARLTDVVGILEARNSERDRQSGSHVDRLCKSLIDGPIDADKLDYLQRDSRHCNVRYGYGIDTDRLFRCLTVAHSTMPNRDELLLVLGVHEKGRLSAESVLFARYAMLTQVYWHHTMRGIKALLQHAAVELLIAIPAKERAAARDALFRCAILGENVTTPEWDVVRTAGSAVASIHAGDLRVLGWLWQRTTNSGRTALVHILNRSLFRRLVTIYREEMTDERRERLEKAFKPDKFSERNRLRAAVEEALRDALRNTRVRDDLLDTSGFSPEEWAKRLEAQGALRCLIDYPAPRPGAAFGLKVVRQWGERPSDASGGDAGEIYPQIIPSSSFRDGMRELEKSIASLRVFWHPEESAVVKESLGDERIKEIVLTAIETCELD